MSFSFKAVVDSDVEVSWTVCHGKFNISRMSGDVSSGTDGGGKVTADASVSTHRTIRVHVHCTCRCVSNIASSW